MKKHKKIEYIVAISGFVGVALCMILLSQSLQHNSQETSAKAKEPRIRKNKITQIDESDVNKQLNIVYKEDLQLDLYEPKTTLAEGALRPAILWIHGGGFVEGNRKYMEPYAVAFAKKGYVAVTISYRLDRGGDVPVLNTTMLELYKKDSRIRNAEEDARAAVQYMTENAAKYNIDPNKIFIGGFSAGAITSLFVAYPQPELRSQNIKVAGVVSIAGASAPEWMLPGDPPLIMFHGEKDPTVPTVLAQKVRNKATDLKIPNQYKEYPGAGHVFAKDAEIILMTSEFFAPFLTSPTSAPTPAPIVTSGTLEEL